MNKRKNGGVEALVMSKNVKNINEVRGIWTLPGGGWLFVDNYSKVGMVNTRYDWHKQDIAGAGCRGCSDDKGLNATFNSPMCVMEDEEGNIVVADSGNNCLRKIDKKGMVSKFTGGNHLYDNTGLLVDTFDNPNGMVQCSDGRIAVVDTGNNCVRLVSPDGRSQVLCGGPEAGYKDGKCDGVLFNEPHGIVLLSDDTFLVSDTGNHVLRKISWDGSTITMAGGEQGFKDGPRLEAKFDSPKGMAVTWDGIVVVADMNNNRVRQIDGDVVSTLAGSGEYSQGRQRQCVAALASFRSPIAVGIDHEGNVLVCEESPVDDEIRVITDTGYAPASHHLKHHMKKVIGHTGMAIVETVTDWCRLESYHPYEEICKNALMTVNVSAGARESGRDLLKHGMFSDLHVEFEGRTFNLHAAVMANGSNYFMTALAEPHISTAWNRKTKDNKYFLKFDASLLSLNVSAGAFVMVVDFIYSGSVIASEEDTIKMTGWTEKDGRFCDLECDILKLADFFHMEWMVSVYTTLFYTRLTPTTVIDKLALIYKVPGLKAARQAAIDYLAKNVAAVQEQDPEGWDNLKRLKSSVVFDVLNTVTATKKAAPTYLEGFGDSYVRITSDT